MTDHKQKALAILKQYPEETQVFVTQDGMVFLAKNKRHAQNHANTIGGKLAVVLRPTAELEPEDNPDKEPKPKSKAKPKGKVQPETETPE